MMKHYNVVLDFPKPNHYYLVYFAENGRTMKIHIQLQGD